MSDIKRFDRYKKNLHMRGDKVYSYDTHVATVNHKTFVVTEHNHYSVTTTKHVNYVAGCFGYNVYREWKVR